MNVCRTDQLDLSTVWCSVCRTDRLDLSTVWCSVCNALNFLLVHFISELVPNLCLCLCWLCCKHPGLCQCWAKHCSDGLIPHLRYQLFHQSWGICETDCHMTEWWDVLFACTKADWWEYLPNSKGGGGGILFLCKEFGELSVWQTLLLAKWIKEEPKEDSIVKAQSWEPLETCGIFCSSKQPLLWSLTRQAFVLL